MLADAYLKGYGVKQDPLKAREYFAHACYAGVQEACGMYRQLNETQ
ncbi:hypothetical protein [Avibacterium avium]